MLTGIIKDYKSLKNNVNDYKFKVKYIKKLNAAEKLLEFYTLQLAQK